MSGIEDTAPFPCNRDIYMEHIKSLEQRISMLENNMLLLVDNITATLQWRLDICHRCKYFDIMRCNHPQNPAIMSGRTCHFKDTGKVKLE